MPVHSQIHRLGERQLLPQMGERIKLVRKQARISMVDLAKACGISRTTLYGIEAGDPSATMGTYLRVASALGQSIELTALGTGAAQPLDERPQSSTPVSRHHELQDLQSLVMHEEAVQLLKKNPELVSRAFSTLERWSSTIDPRTRPLLDRWKHILETRNWKLALSNTERAKQLRQASPLATLLPQDTRLRIIAEIRDIKRKSSQSHKRDEVPA